MRIVVCIKQVPGGSQVRMDPVTNTLVREGAKAVTNPFDAYAIELAVRLKAELGAEVVALSMGIPATGALLLDAAARGADRCVLLTDRAFAGADTLATSYTLALGIRRLGGADLVLCGRMAVDGDTAQIGPELAEALGLPHLTEVDAVLEADASGLTVQRSIEGGAKQTVRLGLPALLCVTKEIGFPTMPSIAGVRASRSVAVETFDAEALGADPARIGLNGSPTQVVRTFVPQRGAEALPVEGTAGQQAARLWEIFREVGS